MKRTIFTLIELLVVVAVISLLASLLLPALGKAKAYATGSACMSNLRQCGTFLISYSGDFNGWVLSGESVGGAALFGALPDLAIQCGYMKDCRLGGGAYAVSGVTVYSRIPEKSVFRCPSLPNPSAAYSNAGINLPVQGWSLSLECYGLRTIWQNAGRYAGEILSPVNSRMPLYSSLNMTVPFMADTMSYKPALSGGGYVQDQTSNWYLDGGAGWAGNGFNGFQLRHSNAGDVWFPDGHASRLTANETAKIKQGGAGTTTTTPIGFSY